MEFERGDEVEIVGNEEGLEGSYYEAIIISKVSDKEYIVQYKTLMKDDLSGPLRAFIPADEIRPAPGPEDGGLSVNKRVDVYYNDGWWVGKISKISGAHKYHVRFEHTVDEGEYPFTQIRCHRDWVHGRWL